MYQFNRPEQPCRLCGMDTTVPGRVCWTCRRIAHDAEADASGISSAEPGALQPLWGTVVARHLLRRAVADRPRNGLTPLDAVNAVVVEFERPEATSRFVTFTAAAFDATDLPGLRQQLDVAPDEPGGRVRVHDGRRLFSTAVTARLRAAGTY